MADRSRARQLAAAFAAGLPAGAALLLAVLDRVADYKDDTAIAQHRAARRARIVERVSRTLRLQPGATVCAPCRMGDPCASHDPTDPEDDRPDGRCPHCTSSAVVWQNPDDERVACDACTWTGWVDELVEARDG